MIVSDLKLDESGTHFGDEKVPDSRGGFCYEAS